MIFRKVICLLNKYAKINVKNNIYNDIIYFNYKVNHLIMRYLKNNFIILYLLLKYLYLINKSFFLKNN